MTDTRDDRLRLAFAALHPDRAQQLRNRFGVGGALRYLEAQTDVAESVRKATTIAAEDRRTALIAGGFNVTMRGDEDYPEHLSSLPDAPDVLFFRGSFGDVPMVAIVGTRACSTYGRQLAADYGAAISEAGWGVVSGLARGVDGAAHRGLISADGVGIAVLGCGLDIDYPPEHAPLADELVECGGAIVSEYPPGTRPEGWRFPPGKRQSDTQSPSDDMPCIAEASEVQRCPSPLDHRGSHSANSPPVRGHRRGPSMTDAE